MSMFQATPANWLRWAVLYLVVGVTLGNYMGMTSDFSLGGVHAHLNLLGWVSMALAGLIYRAWPAAGQTVLARAHFWIHLAFLPVMMVALGYYLRGVTAVEPMLGLAALAVGIGWLLFAVNLFRTVRD
jgi:hypothetical protein